MTHRWSHFVPKCSDFASVDVVVGAAGEDDAIGDGVRALELNPFSVVIESVLVPHGAFDAVSVVAGQHFQADDSVQVVPCQSGCVAGKHVNMTQFHASGDCKVHVRDLEAFRSLTGMDGVVAGPVVVIATVAAIQ